MYVPNLNFTWTLRNNFSHFQKGPQKKSSRVLDPLNFTWTPRNYFLHFQKGPQKFSWTPRILEPALPLMHARYFRVFWVSSLQIGCSAGSVPGVYEYQYKTALPQQLLNSYLLKIAIQWQPAACYLLKIALQWKFTDSYLLKIVQSWTNKSSYF